MSRRSTGRGQGWRGHSSERNCSPTSPCGSTWCWPTAPGTPGRIGWHELLATDWQKAFTFYSDLFGWQKGEAHDMGPMGTYQLFSAGGTAGYEWTWTWGGTLRVGGGASYWTAFAGDTAGLALQGVRPELDASIGWVF